METRRLVDAWLSGKAEVNGVAPPAQYSDRTQRNPKTGKKIGPIDWFERYYEKYVANGALIQLDLFEIDRSLYESLDARLIKDKSRLSERIPSARGRKNKNLA